MSTGQGAVMTDFDDVPAGTAQARAGLNFTRINGHGGIATDADRQLRLQVDGRYIAEVWEAVPGSWSITGVAGYRTGFGSAVDAEDAVIAAYHQLPVRADYEIDLLVDEQWHTVWVGRCGVDVDRLATLGAKAREIAAEYHELRGLPVRVTLWSTTAPTSRVTTYAEYRQEELMPDQFGQGQGQSDPLTADPLTPAAGPVNPVNVDWSTLGQADRVWRVNPATGQPQGLTVDTVNADTVTGQLDDGPGVTLPLTDIAAAGDPPGQMIVLEDEVTALFGAASGDVPGRKTEWMRRVIAAAAADPDTLVWVYDPKAGGTARAWMAPLAQEDDAAMLRDVPPASSAVRRGLDAWLAKASPEEKERLGEELRRLVDRLPVPASRPRPGDYLWPDPDARARW